MSLDGAVSGLLCRVMLRGELYFAGVLKVNKRSVRVLVGKRTSGTAQAGLTGEAVTVDPGQLYPLAIGRQVPHDCPLKLGDFVTYPDRSGGLPYRVTNVADPSFVGVAPADHPDHANAYAHPGNLLLIGRASLTDLRADLGLKA